MPVVCVAIAMEGKTFWFTVDINSLIIYSITCIRNLNQPSEKTSNIRYASP